MPQDIDIRVPLDRIDDQRYHKNLVARKMRTAPRRLRGLQLLRRSIDARSRPPIFQLRYRAFTEKEPQLTQRWDFELPNVEDKPPVIIVGFGPAGMFAALQLIELGLRPIVLERGKDVRGRRRDLARLNKEGVVNPESNYCFGEGGAGTFSDGKLYTRSKKRGDIQRVLEILVAHGASEDILIDAHPHIGTNKLPKIIQSMRETIIAHGGRVEFGEKVTGLVVKEGKVKGVKTAGGGSWEAESVLLATGHSARDIFRMVHAAGLTVEAKPFALGVRIEHPQGIIDRLRYRMSPRHEKLPAASYSLVAQADGRGVYSFCMCPGGIICPAATAEDELVVNGWSPSRRDSPYANSGIVVEVTPQEYSAFDAEGPFAAMAYQAAVEERSFTAGGGAQVAPAQRLTDFLAGQSSSHLPNCSYLPGLAPVNLHEVLPPYIAKRLALGFRQFDQKMRGYVTEEAVVVATESRTSSPVRIPRDPASLMHPEADGLFPCGEGPGYAGGIMSAAMDGERCARAIGQFMEVTP